MYISSSEQPNDSVYEISYVKDNKTYKKKVKDSESVVIDGIVKSVKNKSKVKNIYIYEKESN